MTARHSRLTLTPEMSTTNVTTFEVYNSYCQSASLTLSHPMSLSMCTCSEGEDDNCIYYTVGYNLADLCDALKLRKGFPVYLTSPSNLQLEVITDENWTNGEGPIVLIPVHKTSEARRGLHN
jgi:hypothetical protein